MPREGGASSTPRPIVSTIDVSGILDHPPQCAIAHKAGDDGRTRGRDLAAHCVRALHRRCPPQKSEGAGKTGCLLHPRSRVRFALTKRHTSIQGSAKHSGLPCAMALRLTSCSPRRTALLPPSPARSFASPGLSASTATPEPHDFAVRFRRVRLARHLRPSHLTARS